MTERVHSARTSIEARLRRMSKQRRRQQRRRFSFVTLLGRAGVWPVYEYVRELQLKRAAGSTVDNESRYFVTLSAVRELQSSDADVDFLLPLWTNSFLVVGVWPLHTNVRVSGVWIIKVRECVCVSSVNITCVCVCFSSGNCTHIVVALLFYYVTHCENKVSQLTRRIVTSLVAR